MAQPNSSQKLCKEADILLAISAIKSKQIGSTTKAAAVFNVPETSLRRRRDGIPSRRDCQANSKKLTALEEEVIIQYILKLDSRGFSPTLSAVRDMANKLLAERDAGQVGNHWPRNFVKRTPRLTTRFNRPYDRQRALCEDPEVISRWFELVQRTKLAYGICDADTWNFDETGFAMGKITSQLVVTGSERRNRPKAIQPGDREWVTAIAGISSTGSSIPPFIIFAGQYHLSAWYDSDDIPSNWAISVSDNGWTSNELGIQWIQHFIEHTSSTRIGVYQLLILDGHESHNSVEFHDYCENNNIIALCMPAHSSHLLQPLDVGCFSPLKRAYGSQVNRLISSQINHITKLEFLPAFKTAYSLSITESNIRASYRGAGLVPFDPEHVVSKLDVKLRTPTPPVEPSQQPWDPRTPRNLREIELQATLVQNRIIQHQNSSPTATVEQLHYLTKSHFLMAHEITLLRSDVTTLQAANAAASQRKQRKRKRIQKQGTLTKAEGEAINIQNAVDQQLEVEMRQNRGRGGLGKRATPRCKRCKGIGHNSRTCQQDALNTVQ